MHIRGPGTEVGCNTKAHFWKCLDHIRIRVATGAEPDNSKMESPGLTRTRRLKCCCSRNESCLLCTTMRLPRRRDNAIFKAVSSSVDPGLSTGSESMCLPLVSTSRKSGTGLPHASTAPNRKRKRLEQSQSSSGTYVSWGSS